MLPELAVEVKSPSTAKSERRLRTKIYYYHAAGTVVWVVYPDTREVDVHVPGKAPQTFTEADTLSGGDVLPNFELPVKDIFPA